MNQMVDLWPGSRVSEHVQQARDALERNEFDAADRHYTDALAALTESMGSAEQRAAVAIEHVGSLIARGQLARGLVHGTDYVSLLANEHLPEREVRLQSLLAEASAACGDWDRCEGHLKAAESVIATNPLEDYLNSGPAMARLRGLLAAARWDYESARMHLQDAADLYAATGNSVGTEVVEQDRRLIELEAGNPAAVDEIITRASSSTPSEILTLARALRRDGRFEEAARLLEERLIRPLDPSLRFPFLLELMLIYRVLADERRMERLLPMVQEEARHAPNPTEAALAVSEALGRPIPGKERVGTVESSLQQARQCLDAGDIESAETHLLGCREMANTPRFSAYWSLVAGELELTIARQSSGDDRHDHAHQALAQLAEAERLALEASLPEVYVAALRQLGKVHAIALDDGQTAATFWARASRAVDLFADRQVTDEARLQMLESASTEEDEVVEAAVAALCADEPKRVASVVVAIEAAKGAALLSLVAEPGESSHRELPVPTDPEACWRWCTSIADQLPAGMALWLLHSTPLATHHAILGRGFVNTARVKVRRESIRSELDEFRATVANPEDLELMLERHPDFISGQLDQLAVTLGVDVALKELPVRIKRLAVVPGGVTAGLPFAALPFNGRPMIERFALSQLPCASSLLPLRRRSRRCRGDDELVIRPDNSLLRAVERRSTRRQVLSGSDASMSAMSRALEVHAPKRVRFDCHGKFEAGGARSWLQLAPHDGNDGRLTAEMMQVQSLSSCGTLVLGACESGLGARRGRGEDVGLVRAGLAAGASAVCAASWIAADEAAAQILDDFNRLLAFETRDVALQRALTRWCDSPTAGVSRSRHPARWACWTLHGAPDYQTKAGSLRRGVRRLVSAVFGATGFWQ